MSLILDALRKMEQEKAKKNQAKADIRPDVLRYRGNTQKSSGNKGLLIAVGVVVLIFIIAVIWLLSVSKKNKTVKQQPSAATMSRQTAPAVKPPQPQVAPAQAPIPSAQPQAAPVQAPTQQSQPSAPPQQTSKPAVARPVHNVIRPTPPPKPSHVKRPEKPAPQVAASAPAGITVSGIAWEDNRRLRRAVVNGSLVSEGRLIAGYKVEEIKENSVRLSKGGQMFEAPYSFDAMPKN
jgi:general secretion pathway protein B